MRRELLLPLAVLALGLVAAGGFFAASAVLSEGGGSQVVAPDPQENDEAAPPGLLRRAFLGVRLAEEPDGGGLRITEVVPGSPADEAGLEEGDVITAVDGVPVFALEAVVPRPPFIPDILGSRSPGDQVTYTVRRDGEEKDVTVTLGRRAALLPMPPASPREAPPDQAVQPYLGVDLADITPEIRDELDLAQDSGVVIVEVDRDGPAYDAGLRRGDVVLQIGPQWVETAGEAVAAVLDHEPGEKLSLLIRRGFRELGVEVQLEARPGTGPPIDVAPAQPGYWSWWRLVPLSDLVLDLDLDRLTMEELFGRFVGADVVVQNGQGEHVELHVTAGFLIDVSATEIRLAPNGYSGIDRRFAVTEKTRVLRGLVERELEDLRPGDRVLVLTRGASDEALLIFSPPFDREGGLSAVPGAGMVEITLPSAGLY